MWFFFKKKKEEENKKKAKKKKTNLLGLANYHPYFWWQSKSFAEFLPTGCVEAHWLRV